MSKKRRPRVALISLVGLILVLLVGTFTWLHFNSTRQLPLGSRQKGERLPRVKIKGAVSQTVDKNPTVRFSFKDRKTGGSRRRLCHHEVAGSKFAPLSAEKLEN